MKNFAQLKSASSSTEQSQSETPNQQHTSVRPRVRNAQLMDLLFEGVGTPKLTLPKQQALITNCAPGGSMKYTEDKVEERLKRELSSPCAHVLEQIEALDISDEEVEEIMEKSPWQIQRILDGLKQQMRECSTQKPPTPATSAEEGLGHASRNVSVHKPSNAQSVPKVSSVDADAPSTTELTRAANMPVDNSEFQGSDLDSDSEYDDELDDLPILTSALAGGGRGIHDDEVLEQPVRQAIHAVERAMDDETDRMFGVSHSFDWDEGFETFKSVPEKFTGPTPGPLKEYDEPYDAFTDIWSSDIMELIAQETNRYAQQTIDALKVNGTLKPKSRLHFWHETDADEIAIFFAAYMYMAIAPRTSINEFWKTNNCLEMPRFKEMITYERYVLLNKFLHFVDNSDAGKTLSHNEGNISKRLAKLQPVISHLNSKFPSLYNMRREIVIDESLTLFKGRSFAQIKSKTAGIKSFELCESQSGYLYAFSIYTRNDSDGSSAFALSDLGGKTTRIVLELLKDLKHLGHSVTMDNFYNCPSLARYLKSMGFDCLGTLRTNRKHVPSAIRNIPNNVEKGTIIARQCGDVSIIAWKDTTNLVTMISTYHTDGAHDGSMSGRLLSKPTCVQDYNRTMGGVDFKDKMLSTYLIERKRAVKWYVKLFKRLLNVSIHNAFVMYVSSLRRRNLHALTHREFRYKLAKSLVEKHRRSAPAVSVHVDEQIRLRLDLVHSPKHWPGKNCRKRCRDCLRQGKEKLVRTQCLTCDEYICFGTCWDEWHSLRELNGSESRGRKRKRI